MKCRTIQSDLQPDPHDTRCEKVIGAKINRNMSLSLRLAVCKVVALPRPFCWTDEPVRIFEVWFGFDFQLENNWSEVQEISEQRPAFGSKGGCP